MRLYVIRHGDPNYEVDSLTPLGFDQAYKLGEKYKNVPMDAFYISTHGRACRTAEPLLKYHPEAKTNYVDWAREDLGAHYFAGTTDGVYGWFFYAPKWIKLFKSQEIASYGTDWAKQPEIAKTTMPEGFKVMSESVDAFMLELGYEHDRKSHTYKKIRNDGPQNVTVVAHGGFAFSFISNLLDIPYPEFVTTHSCLDCTGVVVIDFPDGSLSPMIVKYNDISHLDVQDDLKKPGF